MNYRHAFHAGNFADCMKHALLVALLRALQRKPGPLFVLDTHAGAGHYDLGSGNAARTNEAAAGILRLLGSQPRHGPIQSGHQPSRDDASGDPTVVGLRPAFIGQPPSPPRHGPARPGHQPDHDDASGDPTPAIAAGDAAPLADYLSQVRALGLYPGSPELTRSLLRRDDRLACCELHPEEFATLRTLFRRDNQVAVHQRDGWEALKALLPPTAKRGLVLIDPPYEQQTEFMRLAEGLAVARGRFGTGVLAAWYPIKNKARERAFFDSLALRDVIVCELLLREPWDPARLNGCGMLIVNPPYQFEQEAQIILDALLARLGNREVGEVALVTRLTDE